MKSYPNFSENSLNLNPNEEIRYLLNELIIETKDKMKVATEQSDLEFKKSKEFQNSGDREKEMDAYVGWKHFESELDSLRGELDAYRKVLEHIK